jgi:hypothetical protein
MPRLIAISFVTSPKLPGLHSALSSTFFVGTKNGPLAHWTVAVRKGVIVLTSPIGWKANGFDRTERERTVYEVPRSEVSLQWVLDEGETTFEPGEWTQPVAVETAGIATSPGHQGGHMTPTVAVEPDDDSDVDDAPVKRGPGRPRKVVV